MNLHNNIMNIQATIIHDGPEGVGNVHSNRFIAYKEGHRDARHAAAELSLKAESRIEELENALQELYLASGPVANCAYNAGQRHEDWDNIKRYIDKLDSARMAAVNVFKENK